MSYEFDQIHEGHIAWANVLDPRGKDRKKRPILVLQKGLPDDATALVCVGISSRYPDPPRSVDYELPWSPDGRARTGLRKRSAAVITWAIQIHAEDVLQLHGELPRKHLAEINRLIRELSNG